MNYRNTYNKIRGFISEDLLENAIIAMRCIVLDQQFADTISNLSRAFYGNERARMSNTEEYTKLSIERSRIAERLLNLLNDVPDDFTLVKNRLIYEVKNTSNFFKSTEILSNCINDYTKYAVTSFKDRYEKLNEKYLILTEATSLEDMTVSEVSKEQEKLTSEYLTYLNDISLNHLKFNFYDFFWKATLEDKSFQFQSYIERPYLVISDFLHDIKQNDSEIRALLLLWEEEYLSGFYSESLHYINKIRIDLGIDNSTIYEYTALSFLDANTSDKIINQLVIGKKNTLFSKLKLYIDRSKKSEKQSSTINNSAFYIYKKLSSSLEKLYNNINHDYIIFSERGQTRKRNTLKSILETIINISDAFSAFDIDVNNLVKQLILELDGGGKYRWLTVDKGTIENHSNFDAKSARDNLLSKFPDYDNWGANLFTALQIKKGQINEENSSYRFLQAVELGDFLYPNFGFKDLILESIKTHKQRIRPTIHESKMQEQELVQEQKEGQELIERYEENITPESPEKEILNNHILNSDDISDSETTTSVESGSKKESATGVHIRTSPSRFSYIMLFISIVLLIETILCLVIFNAIFQ